MQIIEGDFFITFSDIILVRVYTRMICGNKIKYLTRFFLSDIVMEKKWKYFLYRDHVSTRSL